MTADERAQWAPASINWTFGRKWLGASSGEFGSVDGVELAGDRLEFELLADMEVECRSAQVFKLEVIFKIIMRLFSKWVLY